MQKKDWYSVSYLNGQVEINVTIGTDTMHELCQIITIHCN